MKKRGSLKFNNDSESYSEKKGKSGAKKFIFFSIIAIILIFLILFGAEAYLYVNLMLGNDVMIKLNTEKENLFLTHGNSELVKFTTSVITNPFCVADCKVSFKDLSSNEIIEETNFKLKVIDPISEEYNLTAPLKGTGQKLYRFDVSCTSKRTTLCHTKEEERTRNVLITLNYDLSEEEKTFEKEYREKLSYSITRLNFIENNIGILKNTSLKLKGIDISDYELEINSIESSVSGLNYESKTLFSLFNEQDYGVLSQRIVSYEGRVELLNNSFNEFNFSFIEAISTYNSLIENLTVARNLLLSFEKYNVSSTTLIKVNEAIDNFNSALTEFNVSSSLLAKEKLVNNRSEEVRNTRELVLGDLTNPDANLITIRKVEEIQLEKVNIPYGEFISLEVNFSQQNPECCFEGNCGDCCDNSCNSMVDKYPIILLHGHDFNRAISSEQSLNAFDGMQKMLENERYLNVGVILINSKNEIADVWGKTQLPVSIRASYYFDVIEKPEESVIIQTKADSIDSYALRLNEIIKAVKVKTGRDKVNIVTTSMGGLVSRRYLQIFGSSEVNKLIMIATPNSGISGTALTYCSVFGAKLECSDMDKDSLFMNKLNRNLEFDIPVYNIVGIGCDTDNEDGDGIVKKSSAILPEIENGKVKNFFVEGKCEGTFQYFHSEIVNGYKYPETYDIVKDALKENSTSNLFENINLSPGLLTKIKDLIPN